MSTRSFTLDYVDKGRNPYKVIKTPTYIGTDIIQIYPGKYRDMDLIWEIIWIGLGINTDATVANRIGRIYVRGPGGANGALVFARTANIPASQTDINMQVNYIGYDDGNVDLSEVEYIVGYSQRIPLIGPEGNVYVDLVNGQAGDSIIVNALFQFKNHELGVYPSTDLPRNGTSFPEGTKWD